MHVLRGIEMAIFLVSVLWLYFVRDVAPFLIRLRSRGTPPCEGAAAALVAVPARLSSE